MASEVQYDVYSSPRIGATQFGAFVAGDGHEREVILRASKYARRSPKARAWFARQEIASFLSRPRRSVGDIDAAISVAHEIAENEAASEQKREDAKASRECLKSFLTLLNKLPITGREIVSLNDEQFPAKIGPLSIQVDLACLLRSVDKSGNNRIGAIFINTQKGKGLGSKDDTIKKRNKAGEAVALLAYKRLMDEFSDLGSPMQSDTFHVYLRAEHFWPAPESVVRRLQNMDADARAITAQWDSIRPPADFDPERANFHE